MDQQRCYRDQDPSEADYGVSYLGDKERCTSDSKYNRWMFGWMLSQLVYINYYPGTEGEPFNAFLIITIRRPQQGEGSHLYLHTDCIEKAGSTIFPSSGLISFDINAAQTTEQTVDRV